MKALLLGNGEPPTQELFLQEAQSADLIVCADGAATWATGFGVLPHVLVGDIDSLSESVLMGLRRQGVSVERHMPEKDDTDMQLAAECALNRGADRFVLLGGTGGRLDHTLGNMQVLAFLRSKGAFAEMKDAFCTVRIVRDERVTIAGKRGGEFSLVPLGENVIVAELSGAKYPLSNRHLLLTRALGISNVFSRDKITLHVKGAVAFIHVEK